jgi:type IV fimbrial biogenesis protein FimT
MKAQKGFTLVELMVTLAVAIILMAASVPLFRGMVAGNALVTQTNTLVTALNLARSEAVKRGAGVAVCPKATADVADTDCGGNGNWTNGWHVFTDAGVEGTFDAGDAILRHWEPLPGAAGLTSAVAFIRFEADGSAGAAEQTFRVAYAGSKGGQERCVRVLASGAIRTHQITETATCP